MYKTIFFTIICSFISRSILAQQAEDNVQKFAIKFRYFLITYGAGTEIYLNQNNSLQIFGAQNAFTLTPSIDPSVETTGIVEYKHYFQADSITVNRWFVAPYLRYSYSEPGYGDVEEKWITEWHKDKSVGIVWGRQVFVGKGSMVHFDFFVGPQIGFRQSKDKLVLKDPVEVFVKSHRGFTWTFRLGVNMGISLFRKQK